MCSFQIVNPDFHLFSVFLKIFSGLYTFQYSDGQRLPIKFYSKSKFVILQYSVAGSQKPYNFLQYLDGGYPGSIGTGGGGRRPGLMNRRLAPGLLQRIAPPVLMNRRRVCPWSFVPGRSFLVCSCSWFIPGLFLVCSGGCSWRLFPAGLLCSCLFVPGRSFLVWSVPGRSGFVPGSMNRNDAGAER